TNVFSRLDFDRHTGTVRANADTVTTTLPYNFYNTSMNEFEWDMQKEKVTFRGREERLGLFRSLNPEQDGLQFEGRAADYNLTTNELTIDGVPRIFSADAYIYPSDGVVKIRPGGIMESLENARIELDTATQYHTILRANVEIQGAKQYKATGFYEYPVGSRQQEIQFTNIQGQPMGKGKRSERAVHTRAKGSVAESDDFYMDEKLKFSGEISLNGEEKALQFDGFAQIQSDQLPNSHWFSISCKADRHDLAIAYDAPKDPQGQALHTGIYLSKSNAQLYPAILSPLQFHRDRPIITTKGLLRYDVQKDLFEMGDSLKLASGVKYGNKLSLNNQNGELIAEGQFEVGSGLDYIDLTVVGQAKLETQADAQVKFDWLAGIDLQIPEKLLKVIATDLQASSFDAQVIDYRQGTEFYEKALSELIPDAKSLHYAIANMKTQMLDLPDQYDTYSLFFSHLPMVWHSEYQSFISARKKLGLGSIAGIPINRWLTSYVEFKMPSNEDDRVYIYLKSPSDYYYYFSYRQGVLSTVSNNEKYNAAVEGLKKKEKSRKMEDGELYEIQLVETTRAQQLIARMKAAVE
ncbi:MAG: hypothetical protein AAFP19_16210, partial [Bacteroidota bacterium]